MTNYTYNSVNLTTATTSTRIVKTTVDALGRTVRVETGDTNGTLSQVDTTYDSCACSPLGKVKSVSRPYAPGATPVWTTYTYDALGRTTRIDLPGATGAVTYAYVGNTTTVTDPAGKWKKYTSDALGNLIQVTEPAPEGGTHETYYTYNVLGQMTQVQMPRTINRTVVIQMLRGNPATSSWDWWKDGMDWVTNVTYGPAGELMQMKCPVFSGWYTKTQAFNTRGQLTRLTATNDSGSPANVDLEYRYSPTPTTAASHK